MKPALNLRTARHIHRWIGAVLASFLLIIALSGTALIWKDSYLRLVFPQPEHHFDANSVTQLALAAEAAFGDENIILGRINERTNLMRLSLRDGRAAYLNADGAVLEVWLPNVRIEDWLLDLHHRFLSGTRGLYLSGFIGIAALVSILFGVLAFWPARRAWRQGFRLRGTGRMHMLTSHRNSGIVLAAPLFILILSGVFLTFPTISRNALLWFHNPAHYGETFGDGVDDLEGNAESTWGRAIARTLAVFPDAQITALTWPIGGNERVIHIRTTGEWADAGNSSVQITVPDGYMDIRIDATQLPAGERTYNLLAALHTSQLGGRLYDIIQTVLGLGAAWLALLGLVSFIRKPRG
ncbi:PepSY-associated TM helix domain-containing protein [Pseudorhodobacter sp. W20_MBD10_FR17]|uniref:PepSY-associated TM helix domain-containing protein n=1 Tax=Pseudorhodobacter sp. W20_MBD10_FR17 TaxID=3240266 RepID=UPI003F9C99B4